MSEVIDIFKEIIKIPHCSYNTDKLKDYIIKKSKEYGAEVSTDKAGNILARKGKPEICLQSHYDMVCVGSAPDIEVVEKNGKLKAKSSSLGADNGIGVAISLYILKTKNNVEALFTNNEEVGLLGAKDLELDIKSKYLLNLDSEIAGEICLGCAGGLDITATIEFKKEKPEQNLKLYKVETEGFPGGHSGVDIDKNIKNAIKELSYFLKENKCKLVSINGGEARNSIPKNAEALVYCENELKDTENIKVERQENAEDLPVLGISDKLIDFLVSFSSGVRSYDKDLGIPLSSVNLATIKTKDDKVEIGITPRFMSEEDKRSLLLEIETHLKSFGFYFEKSGEYPFWKPEIGEFAKKVREIASKHFGHSNFYAIHAGLECGVIVSKYPNLEAVSIGPTIVFPHSDKEEVDIESIEKTLKIVEDLID